MKFFFDLDGTITESRQKITDEMYETLKGLKSDIVVISGAEVKQIKKQIGDLTEYIMGQSGNETPYWKNELKDKEPIFNHINKIQKFLNLWGDDLIQDRGCQISFSFVGHNEDIEKKKLFDKSGIYRKTILQTIPFLNDKIECRVAGTTCLDYNLKGNTKGNNIERFIKEMSWNKDECIYFGDALFKGGNDETVIGVIKTVEVVNPQDLLSKIKNYV